MEENDLLEDRQFMYPTLRSLQEMASHNVALSVWHHYYYSCAKYSEDLRNKFSDTALILYFGVNDTYKEDCHGMIKSLKLPRSIEDEIKYALSNVWDEMEMWIRQLKYYCATPVDLSVIRIKCIDFDKIVWFSNGFVHHEMSARKILSSVELSPAVKFSIMSEFCLEDEMVNFDLNSLPQDFVQQVTVDESSKYPLLNYWVRYLKKELHLGTFRSPATINKYYENHRTAFKYFWHLLDSNDRESLVEILFSSDDQLEYYPNTYLYQYYNKERLFFMLSSSQQQHLLSRYSDRIIVYFSIHRKHEQSALWAWRQSKEFMSFEQFCHVMKRPGYYYERYASLSLHMKIWKTAPDSLRQSLQNCDWYDSDIISRCLDNLSSPSACKFFIEFLSLKSANSRKRIITERAHEFGCAIKDLHCLQELLDLCLPDIEEQLEFKRKVVNSYGWRSTCTELLRNMNFDDLKTKLEFYIPDRSGVQKFIWQLLNKPRSLLRFIEKLDDWNKLSNFINEIFHGDASVSLDLKKRFISSLVSSYYYCPIYPQGYNYDHVDEMIQIMETIFVNEELEDIKRLFLDLIKREFTTENYFDVDFEENYIPFDVACLLGILSWCLRYSNEQTIREFKNNFLPVDNIFDGIFFLLKTPDSKYEYNSITLKKILFKLNGCLRWYMPSEEERKKYKRSRINETNNFKIFDVLRFKEGYDLEILLEWLFEGDEEAITEFKLSKLKLE